MLTLGFSLWLDLRGKPCSADLDTLLNLYTGVRQKLSDAALPPPSGQAVAGVLHLAADLDEDDEEEDDGLSMLVVNADGELHMDGAKAGTIVQNTAGLSTSLNSRDNLYVAMLGAGETTLPMFDAALSEPCIVEGEDAPYLLVEIQSPVGLFALSQAEGSDRVGDLQPIGAILRPDEALWYEALKTPGSGTTAAAPDLASIPPGPTSSKPTAAPKPAKRTKKERGEAGADKAASKRDGPSRRSRRRARGTTRMAAWPEDGCDHDSNRLVGAFGRRVAAFLAFCGSGGICLADAPHALAAMANVPTRAGRLAAEMGLPAPGLTPAGVAEADLPVGAILLRAIGQAGNQEQLLRRSAALTPEERFAQGVVVGRQQVALSVELLLKNTGLERLPGCGSPVASLNGIRRAAGSGTGALTSKELLDLAQQYGKVQAQIRAAYDQLPAAVREEGMLVEGQLRAADGRATAPYWSDNGLFAQGRPGVEMQEGEKEKRAREAELERVMKASLEARRELGQRTSASELNDEALVKALYGKAAQSQRGSR